MTTPKPSNETDKAMNTTNIIQLKLELTGTTLPDGKYMFFVPLDYEVQYVSGNTVLVRRDDLYQEARRKETLNNDTN